MNKFPLLLVIIFSTLTLFSSCKEEEDPAIFVKSALLAGGSGQSKSWKLTSFKAKLNSEPEEDIMTEFGDCEKDNIYTFTNNANQDYQATEGATKCDSEDADIMEKGSWAITNDANGAIISINLGAGLSGFPLFFILTLNIGANPKATIVQLTETNFQCKYTYSDGEDTVTYTLGFIKV